MQSFCVLTLCALFYTVVVQINSKVISTLKPSSFVLQETKKWFCGTSSFQNCSSDEEISKSIIELLFWKTPDYIVKEFPYYLSGLSDDELPIYIAECGKFRVVALLNQGPEVVKNIDKAIAQAIVRGLASIEKGGLDGTNHNIYAILDFEGLEYSHYANFAALELMRRIALQYRVMVERFVEKVYLINANYAVDTLYNMFRPILGRLSERVEIYGPKKSKWLPVLKRAFPLDALPPWYGGYGNFTPVAAYG